MDLLDINNLRNLREPVVIGLQCLCTNLLTLPVLLPCLSVADRMISDDNGSPNLRRGSSHKHLRMLGTSASGLTKYDQK